MNKTLSLRTNVEAKGLKKVYWDGPKELCVFHDVSFEAAEGEGVAILGPSGCGKTTLLNILSGLDSASKGSVKIGGLEISSLREDERAEFRGKHVGFIFQFYHLLGEFTAFENVWLAALAKDPNAKLDAAREKAKELLGKVGLGARLDHFPDELSGGEKQRVAIARALMNSPQVLFCDEPTGNLDRGYGQEIIELLKWLYREERKTVVMVTHDEHVAKAADRVWLMPEKRWAP